MTISMSVYKADDVIADVLPQQSSIKYFDIVLVSILS